MNESMKHLFRSAKVDAHVRLVLMTFWLSVNQIAASCSLFAWDELQSKEITAVVQSANQETGSDSLEGDAFQSAAKVFKTRCVACHQDSASEGDFSLSNADSAFREGHIVPGDTAASRLWEVIQIQGGVSEMPKEGDPLSDSERRAIERWILRGAKWPEGQELEPASIDDSDWWSFQPIKRPQIPIVQNPAISDETVTHPIDAFLIKKLRDANLSPSPIADRRTYLRRLKFDLLGLPPTVQEMESFLTDKDPNAESHWVERFLSSQHYGERWARHWLDVAKYADTCGYDKDKLRPNAWPYRDYVIRSLNEDKPYRKFVREQIAGDVLYQGQADGILGLGFIAAGPWDFIGHVEVPESKLDGKVARNLDRDDMVSGVFNTFCSLTVQCARCHHHKFDPISQQQYYGLQAIFAAVDRAERPYDTDPSVEVRKEELRAAIDKAKAQLEKIEQAMLQDGGSEILELNRRYEELKERLTVRKDPRFGYHSQLVNRPNVEKWVEVDLGATQLIKHVELLGCHDEYADIGAGFGFPVRYRIEVFSDSGDSEPRVVADRTSVDELNPGLNAVRITFETPLSIQRVRITATQLMERQGDYHLALAEMRVLGDDGENYAAGATVNALDSIEAPVRWGRNNLTDEKWAVYLNPEVAKQFDAISVRRHALLNKMQTPERVKEREDWQKRLASAEASLKKLPQGKMVYAAATHFTPQGNFKPTSGTPRDIRVLARGEIKQPLDIARPSLLPIASQVPTTIQPDAAEGQRRAALAEWLTHDENPLLWRSIVNRVWLYHFGQAIVQTPNDFGKMGALPSHPELLDWLAAEFRDGGDWIRRGSIKDLHRLIVSSYAYRQTSDHDPNQALIDAENRLLWRMNRRRLEAEEIRDAMMFVSGALDFTMGGPGYRLFELERPEHSPHYEYHKFDHSDPSTHRRSIYRFIVRSQPNPWMTTMDCADSSQSTPKRDETLTALQSLSLLNNQFNLVMAEKFRDRLVAQQDSLDQQVASAFEIAMQRKASAENHAAMMTYTEQHGLDNLCRFLFNFSEFIYID